jgi:ribulose-phosphate 3-epimerase
VSTISDNPQQTFKNVELFSNSVISGIHFDVMDGNFVPRLGLHPELLIEIRRYTQLPIEVHSMLMTSSKFIQAFSNAGANKIIFHIETTENLFEMIHSTLSLGLQVGLAINPNTDIKSILPYLNHLNSVTLMAVHPGSKGKSLMPNTYERLTVLKDLLLTYQLNLDISIDGGITFENIETLANLGATTFICGSGTIFNPKSSIEYNLERLKLIDNSFRV